MFTLLRLSLLCAMLLITSFKVELCHMWALQASNCDILMKLNVLIHNLIADIVGDPVEEGGHGGEAVRDAGLAAGGADEGGDADEVAALVDERAARVATADALAVTRVDANLEKGYLRSFVGRYGFRFMSLLLPLFQNPSHRKQLRRQCRSAREHQPL